jgi:hypothetical protein
VQRADCIWGRERGEKMGIFGEWAIKTASKMQKKEKYE